MIDNSIFKYLLLVIAVMVLTACGPAATPVVVETEKVVEKPVVQTVVVEKVVEKPVVQTVVVEKVVVVKPGGQLVYARSGEPASLDPGELASNEDMVIDSQMYETLVNIVYEEGKVSFEPGLAEKWESPDGKVWTFYLRRGVKFHDGTDFDAEAVVFAFERQNNPDHPYFPKRQKFWKWIFGDIIAKVEAVDKLTVRFTLRDQFSPFLTNVAQTLAGIPSPTAVERYGDEFGTNPVGTGPFKFVEWILGDRVVVERFDGYRGQLALLDRVIFRAIPDASTRFLEIRAGSIDIAGAIDPDNYELAEKDSSMKVMPMAPLNVGFVYINIAHEPFENLKVRQAVAHAIDKKAIVDAFYAGYGIPAKNILPPASFGYNDDIPDYAYDPELARELLAEAGFPNGFDTTLWVYPPAGAGVGWTKPKEQGEAIQAYLTAVGIRAEIVTWDWTTYLAKTDAGEANHLFMYDTSGPPDPHFFLTWFFGATSPKNSWNDPEVQKVLAQAARVVDLDERTELYREAQEMLHAGVPAVPIAHNIGVKLVRTWVYDYVPHPVHSDNLAVVWVAKP